MIHHPVLILSVLVVIEAAVLSAAAHARTKKYFRFLPAVFWIYFLPMVISSLGLLDSQSPVYGLVTGYGLPASLFLVLIGVDLPAIARLGRTGVLIFLLGSFGIMAGTLVSFALFRHAVGDVFWPGFAAISASWMGGSANMVAVKEATGTPDNVFLPMVVVDTIVPYLWMGLLVAASTWQGAIDHFNHADHTVMEHIRHRVKDVGAQTSVRLTVKNVLLLIILALSVSAGLQYAARLLPVVKGVVSAFTWTIILVSTLALVGSLTSWRRLESAGASKVGYYCLYFVLTTIGAKANVAHLGASVILIGAGFVIVLVHALVLLAAVRIFKVPVMLAAAASQANIGGVVSGPVVAEIYQPGLAAVGLLMAVLGNVIGTYLGIVTGQLCRWMT